MRGEVTLIVTSIEKCRLHGVSQKVCGYTYVLYVFLCYIKMFLNLWILRLPISELIYVHPYFKLNSVQGISWRNF